MSRASQSSAQHGRTVIIALSSCCHILVKSIFHCKSAMASWENYQKVRLYGLEIEPLLQNQYTWVLLVLVVLSLSLRQSKSGNETIDAPIIGSRQSWIARWRFFSDAERVIDEGYSKVGQLRTKCVARANFLAVQDWHVQAQRARHGHSTD